MGKGHRNTHPNNSEYFIHGPGISDVGSYQMSGVPFITGCADFSAGDLRTIEFPYVTKKFTIRASGSLSTSHPAIYRLMFANPDSNQSPWVEAGHHYIDFGSGSARTVNAGQDRKIDQSITLEVKCKQIWLKRVDAGTTDSGFKLYAELTGIRPDEMFELTGSGITDHHLAKYWDNH